MLRSHSARLMLAAALHTNKVIKISGKVHRVFGGGFPSVATATILVKLTVIFTTDSSHCSAAIQVTLP